MMIRLILAGLLPAMAFAALVGGLPAVVAAQPCEVTIASPQTGAWARPDVLVTGQATLPPGAYLHIVARKKGLTVVWPQGGGPAAIDARGEYAVLTSLGEPKDPSGSEFEVFALVLDSIESAKIDAWYQQANRTGLYPGMRMPAFVPGCGAPNKVTVRKTE